MSFPLDLQQLFQRDRVVAVLTAPDGETAEAACRALAGGGLSCAEITFRTEAAANAISRAALIEGFVVGAGTVLSAQQARLARDAGAAFAVAPGTNDEVVRACAELELPFVPGAATATEIDHARNLGCGVVKLFPAGSLGGPGFVKAMSAVYPDVRFVPTGGIDSTSLSAYLAQPSVLACGGSWLVDGRLLAERRFDEVERLAREAVELSR
jgi:2-dehydro-3-deoxyphosphogluconate aldolase / (4S)-4-hydroxy-2-oxoglutarate aldolase